VGVQARRFADGAADVLGLAAGTADKVVMVIADPVFVEGCGVGRLDATDDALVGGDVQDVVDLLARDVAALRADILREVIRGGVRMLGDGPEHGETLRRNG